MKPLRLIPDRLSLAAGCLQSILALGLAGMLASCAAGPRTIPRGGGTDLPAQLVGEPVALLLDKSSRELSVYRDGTLYRRYPVNLGRRPIGPKRFQGDMRTPEGLYRISSKKPHGRWAYFLAIDYPNHGDRTRYSQLLREERVPVLGGETLAIGSGLGLHGSDNVHKDDKDWTRGCVALSNSDVAELYGLVEAGTAILFQH